MDIHDQEQVDKLRRWWAQNGLSVCLGLGIGVSAVLGWRLWEARADKRAAMASEIYEDIRTTLEEETHNETDATEILAEAGASETEAIAVAEDGEPELRKDEELFTLLRDEYPETTYAVLGALQLARREIEADRLSAARGHLEWAVDNAADEALRHLARMRLVRILLALRFLDEAEQRLQDNAGCVDSSVMCQELWGNLHELREAPGEAAAAYREAYRMALEKDEVYLPVLKTKLQALGIEPEELEEMQAAAAETRS